MALARLVMKHLQQQRPPASATGIVSSSLLQGRRQFSDAVVVEKDPSPNPKVSDGGKTSKTSPVARRHRRRGGLWRNPDRHFVPKMFSSGLGNAIVQATEKMSRLLENLGLPAGGLSAGQLKETGECYKLRYEVPGLSKDDVQITVEDGVLQIRAENKEKEAEDDWSAAESYEYYNASLVLPHDAKADKIKAEMKNGVLFVTVPRTEKQVENSKEVHIQ